MNIVFYLSLLLTVCSCTSGDNSNNANMNSKETPRIIIKDGSFILVEMSIQTVSKGEIIAKIAYTNNSNETLPFYKALLPIDGVLKENVFSIFETNSLDQVPYKGTKSEKYLKMAPDDEEGVIIPVSSSERFIVLHPQQKVEYEVNLYKFYDFSNFKNGKTYAVSPNLYLPNVDSNYKQVFEKDSIDKQLKPVYYDVSLPKKEKADSMRIYFSF